MDKHILLRDNDIPDIGKLKVYLENGGYEGLRAAITQHSPDEVIDVVKASGLRGRGGAGFFDWHEVELHPQGSSGQICGRQRRRERAGNLQGSPTAGKQHSSGAGRRADLWLCDSGDGSLYLSARRILGHCPRGG